MRAYENYFNICTFIVVDNFQRLALFTKEQILTILHTPPPTKEEYSKRC